MGWGTKACRYVVVLATVLLVAGPGLAEEQSKVPAESLSVRVPEERRAEFLATLNRFAQSNSPESDTKAIAPNGMEYRAWLANSEVEIIAVNPFDPAIFEVTFYYGTSGHNDQSYIRMVRSAFVRTVTGIAGVAIQ